MARCRRNTSNSVKNWVQGFINLLVIASSDNGFGSKFNHSYDAEFLEVPSIRLNLKGINMLMKPRTLNHIDTLYAINKTFFH